MDDLISVIVPVYNVEKYLDDCVRSILRQTYTNIELILVDDESPDHAGELCDYYSKKDARVKVIHKKNGGLSDARNAGLDICTGTYISFVDADDYIDIDFLTVLHEMISATGCDVAQIGTQRVSEKGVVLPQTISIIEKRKIAKKNEIIEGLLTREIHCSAWCNLYKKSLFDNVRFQLGKLNEDLLMWMSLIDNVESMVLSSDCLYNYRIREGSITRSDTIVRSYRDAIDNALLWKAKICKDKINLRGIENYNVLYYCLVYLKLYGKYDQDSVVIVDIIKKMRKDVYLSKRFSNSERVSLLAILTLPKVFIPFLHDFSFKRKN